MWANLHLLFWLSLIPVLTEWVGEHHTKTAPAATYGVVGLGSAVAFTILVQAIIRADGSSSLVATAIGSDTKGRVSLLAYAAATALAFVSPWISYALFVAVAVMWFIPDRRLSRVSDGRRYLLAGALAVQRGPASPRCSGPGPASGASRGPARRRGTRAARTPGPAAAWPRP